MRIWMTTIVFAIAMMCATAGFAGNDAEKAEAGSEAVAAVEAAPPETPVAAPGPIDGDADGDDASETEED